MEAFPPTSRTQKLQEDTSLLRKYEAYCQSRLTSQEPGMPQSPEKNETFLIASPGQNQQVLHVRTHQAEHLIL